MCDGNDNIEHLYIFPSRWFFLLQFEEFSDDIYEKFQNFLNSNLDRLSLQQLEFEIDSAGYPDKYNFCN